jgi:hypothetical protein
MKHPSVQLQALKIEEGPTGVLQPILGKSRLTSVDFSPAHLNVLTKYGDILAKYGHPQARTGSATDDLEVSLWKSEDSGGLIILPCPNLDAWRPSFLPLNLSFHDSFSFK